MQKIPEERATYQKLLNPIRPDARVTLGEQHIRVYGEVAISSGYYTFTYIREGKNTASAARDTFVYRYREGKWLIVDHHSSRVPG
jgi:hypothetical protein